MLDDRNNSMNKNQDNRNLSEVFKELQEIRYSQANQVNTSSNPKTNNKKSKPKAKVSFIESNNVSFDNKKGIKLSNLLIVLVVLVLVIIAVFPMNVFSVETGDTTDDTEEVVETASIPTDFEINRKALNMQKIISENSSFEKVKEQVSEEREIEYDIQTQQNPTLPRGEQVVLQEGVMGKENVSLVKTYENGEFIEEIILAKETIEEPTPQILDIGTSDFLADLNVHIGDTVYLSKNATLRKEPSEDSEEVADIKNYIDVTLLELPNEDWCKEQKICVVYELIDMSQNFKVTATREWVEQNCPCLLEEKSSQFVHTLKDEYDDDDTEYWETHGYGDGPFLKYCEENFGVEEWDHHLQEWFDESKYEDNEEDEEDVEQGC